jgi:hypothetical protein
MILFPIPNALQSQRATILQAVPGSQQTDDDHRCYDTYILFLGLCVVYVWAVTYDLQ